MPGLFTENFTADNILKTLGAALLGILIWNAKTIIDNQAAGQRQLNAIEVKIERMSYIDERLKALDHTLAAFDSRLREMERSPR